MNNFIKEICQKLPELNVQDMVFNSALNPALDGHGDGAEILQHFLLRKPVKYVLEIGTYNGLTAAFMAQFAEKITTIDIEDYPLKNKIWDTLGVASKIDFILVKTEKEKKQIIKRLKFDVAFVDGNHFGDYPKTDFEMVKHCGRVILHDYHTDFPDVVKFVDSIDSKEIRGLFAYWEDSLSPKVIFTEFNFNLKYVKKYLKKNGLDMGCGCCPVIRKNCLHIDHSPQPKAKDLVDDVIHADAVTFDPGYKVDYIFSSHMVEDLPSKQAIIDCLNGWSKLLKTKGKIVLLLPDMQLGRYPSVESGGNPSHRVNVGVEFINEILSELKELKIIQIDTIPHNKSCTFDVVFGKD